MPDMVVSTTRTVLGLTTIANETVSAESSSVCDGVTLAAAKSGTLSTRTNATSGTITGSSGHGITTGDTIDVYWSGGCRYGVTVGTVSGNSIPISSGSGDDLPVADSAVTFQIPVSESFSIPASSAKSLVVQLPSGKGVVRFRTSAPAVSLVVKSTGTTIYNYGWDATTGGDNPLSTDAIATVLMSNGNTTAQVPKVYATFTTA